MEKVFIEDLKTVLAYRQAALVEEAVRSAAEKPHVFSDLFEQRMKKVIRHEKNGKYKWFGTRMQKLVASIVIALLVMFGSVMSVRAARESIVRFFIEMYEKFSVVFFDTEYDDPASRSVSGEMEFYEPSYVPEGYVEVERKVLIDFLQIRYENKDGKSITYTQKAIKPKGKTIIDTENSKFLTINEGDKYYRYVVKNDYVLIVWHADNSIFMLRGYSLDDLLESAKTINCV